MKKLTIFVLTFVFASGPVFSYAQISADLSEKSIDQADQAINEDLSKNQETEDVVVAKEETKEIHQATPSDAMKDMSIIFRDGISENDFESHIEKLGKDRVWSVFKQQGFNAKLTDKEIETLRDNPSVLSVEPVVVFKTHMADVVRIVESAKANDKMVGNQQMDGTGQTVCVVDTGVDFSHESLTASNILGHNLDCYNGNCINNGVTVTNGHGTHVAGIIAGSGAVRGVAPGAKIISLKVFQGSSGNLDSTIPISNAVNWCKNHAEEYNISVIQMSLGAQVVQSTPCDNIQAFSQVSQAVNQASAQGISVVASSGNGARRTSIDFPACLARATAVAATRKNDTLYGSSNTSQLVRLFAPGANIVSAQLGGGTVSDSGTSMAAPVVSASVAILNQYFESIGDAPRIYAPEHLEDMLFDSGFQFDPDFTGRRINLNKALLLVDRQAPEMVPVLSNNSPRATSTEFRCEFRDWSLGEVHQSIVDASGTIVSRNSMTTNGSFWILSTSFIPPRPGPYKFLCDATDTRGNAARTQSLGMTFR